MSLGPNLSRAPKGRRDRVCAPEAPLRPTHAQVTDLAAGGPREGLERPKSSPGTITPTPSSLRRAAPRAPEGPTRRDSRGSPGSPRRRPFRRDVKRSPSFVGPVIPDALHPATTRCSLQSASHRHQEKTGHWTFQSSATPPYHRSPLPALDGGQTTSFYLIFIVHLKSPSSSNPHPRRPDRRREPKQ